MTVTHDQRSVARQAYRHFMFTGARELRLGRRWLAEIECAEYVTVTDMQGERTVFVPIAKSWMD